MFKNIITFFIFSLMVPSVFADMSPVFSDSTHSEIPSVRFSDWVSSSARQPVHPGLLLNSSLQQPWVVVNYQLRPDIFLVSGMSAHHWQSSTDPEPAQPVEAPKLWSMGVEQQIIEGLNVWVGYQIESSPQQEKSETDQVSAGIRYRPVKAVSINFSGQYQNPQQMGVLAQTSYRF